MQLTDRLARLQSLAAAAGDHLRAPLLLGMRLVWGWQFFATGRGKLANLDRTADFFGSLGIPAPHLNAAMAGATECVGGLLLLAGLGARLVSVPLAATMIVAYLTAHRDSVKTIVSDPDTFFAQAPFLFLLTSLIVLAFGPGALSVDALLARRRGPGANY
jgi:putative oxidoreductase